MDIVQCKACRRIVAAAWHFCDGESNSGDAEPKTIEGIMYIRSASAIRKSARLGKLRIFNGKVWHERYPMLARTVKEVRNHGMYNSLRRSLAGEHLKSEPYDSDKLARLMQINLKNKIRYKEDAVLHDSMPPSDKSKHVAVEIECTISDDRRDLANGFVMAGLSKHVRVKSDGSIQTGSDCSYCNEECTCDAESLGSEECGCECVCRSDSAMHNTAAEIVICAPRDSIARIVERVCDILNNQFDAKVDKSCGLHVHLDMRGSRKKSEVFKALVVNQRLLYSLVPRRRAENSYCKPTRSVDFADERDGDRYKGINATAYNKHRTLEVRIHSGTTSAIKINSWIALLTAIADTTNPEPVKTVVDLFQLVGPLTGMYLMSRLNKFNRQHGEKGWLSMVPDAPTTETHSDNEAA